MITSFLSFLRIGSDFFTVKNTGSEVFPQDDICLKKIFLPTNFPISLPKTS